VAVKRNVTVTAFISQIVIRTTCGMTEEKPVRERDKFMLRLPDGMREQIASEAKNNGRSMNTEIVVRLRNSLEQRDVLADLSVQVDRIEATVTEINQKIGEGRER
jgi:hypothetical protein